MAVANAQQVPINVVGSSIFGRYPKISRERTWNMFMSDDWLVNTPGFEFVSQAFSGAGEGRGLFYSSRSGSQQQFLIAVVGTGVYRIDTGLGFSKIGDIGTLTGEVTIDENLASQICIVDGTDAYIIVDGIGVTPQNIFASHAFSPTYVEYHNTFFLMTGSPGDINPQNWYIFQPKSGFPTDIEIVSTGGQKAIETKADNAVAIKRLPGKGNNIVVFGENVVELWTQVGDVVNYRRAQSFNIDVGCVSANTVAASTEFVIWLAANENNEPSIYITNGGQAQRISTDGIDFILQRIKNPDQSTAIVFRQDGHLFYQLTFFNEEDNLSLLYDFNTQKFFDISDQNFNFHPARQIVYFNGGSYFISLSDANLYEMSTDIDYYKYSESDDDQYNIPRVRIPKSIRKADTSTFRATDFEFWMEQGVNNYQVASTEDCSGALVTEGVEPIIAENGDTILSQDGECAVQNNPSAIVELSISKNGGQSYGPVVRRNLNPVGRYQNRVTWHRMGRANELSLQIRFYGLQRFVVQNGTIAIS